MSGKSAFVLYTGLTFIAVVTALLLSQPRLAASSGTSTAQRATTAAPTSLPTLAPTATIVITAAPDDDQPAPAQTLEPDALTLAALDAMKSGVYVGQVLNPPVQTRDFEAPASETDISRLSDTAGKWRVIFFGYMHCPDFCPLTLMDYKKAKAFLGDAADEVEFLYISVDSIRDTPEAMARYLANFDSQFIGFSPDDATLIEIQPDYGFYYKRSMGTGPRAVYTVDHSTRSYVLDRDGVLRTSFAYDTEPQTIADALLWFVEHE